MLNTDQRNPSIKHKMSERNFVAPQRGVNNGADFSDALLRGYYQEVATTPQLEIKSISKFIQFKIVSIQIEFYSFGIELAYVKIKLWMILLARGIVYSQDQPTGGECFAPCRK